MKKGYQIVIGAAVALALVGGGLAGRAMYVEHQRNQAAAEHAKQEKLMNTHGQIPFSMNYAIEENLHCEWGKYQTAQ